MNKPILATGSSRGMGKAIALYLANQGYDLVAPCCSQRPQAGQVNYSAAKAGIIGATKALALEPAKRDITVNYVAPGLIDTALFSELPLDEIKKMIPARRVGNPNEVAVAFLMSEDAGYITRQAFSVNGGLC